MEEAKAAADGQDVSVMGGADIDQPYLNAGVIDEIRLHVAPMLLGGGTALFEGVTLEMRLVANEAASKAGPCT